ncbi:MAG: tRNA 2-thiouridine(34) synthase MnmA [Candidatus Margulisiibacteriota bacterium]
MSAAKQKKIVVAMSGGVDSSVAAALLKEQGHDLIGITMQVWPAKKSFGGCCSLEAVNDAKSVADRLNIPHYTLNFRDVFQEKVIDNFVEEYKNGRTPNPCIRCNQFIKFDHLVRKAKEFGAEYVATGHYARIVNSELRTPNSKLLKGLDKKKDQAYVLYMMSQESLAHTLYPLGDLTKDQVRKIAKDMDLPVAEKAESQEICFVEDDDYGRFLKEVYPEAVKPGPILDKNGNIVGMHGGIAFYTLGQRKGVGAHKGLPKYVVEIDREKNLIVIGDQEDTLGKELIADQVNYVSGEAPSKALEVTAKIRYNSPEEDAILYPMGEGKAKVEFKKHQRSITPGQSVVFYKGEEVLGGGIITR